jgi:hypothetical protein
MKLHFHDIKPLYFVSIKTGNKFDFYTYSNHGLGGVYRGKIDLPKNEYPYIVEYDENTKIISYNIKQPNENEIKTYITCGSLYKDSKVINIEIKDTWENAKIKLQELRKEDNTIGLRLK